MKITKLNHRTVSVPVRYPVVSSVRKSKEVMFVLLDIETDQGLKGIAYAQAFNVHGAKGIGACLDLFETLLIGEDPRSIEKIWYLMWDSIKLLGHQGLTTFALSMIDIALWDIAGKSVNLPVYRLLGGHRTEIEAYASDALWLVSPQETVSQAEILLELGFKSMKMRLGRSNWKDDLDAVKYVRESIGEDIDLLGDVNQGWTREETIQRSPKLAHYNLKWIEEPIDAQDLEGYIHLSKTIDIPICTGENLYGVRSFYQFVKEKSAAIYTPDLQRIGGISGWKRISTILESYKSSCTIHLFPEFAIHLLASLNYSEKLEWMEWASHLFQEPLECINGVVQIPKKPGFGMEWDESKIKKFIV